MAKNEPEQIKKEKRGTKTEKIFPTHFVALQIKNKGIHDKIEGLQKILGEHKKYKGYLVSPQKLHLTVIVFHLADDDDMEKAKSSLDAAASEIKKQLSNQPLSVSISGLNHFGNRVLFAAVDENKILNQVAEIVMKEFTASGLVEMKSNKFNPHITVMKIVYPFKGVRKIDQSIWLEHKETEFGVEEISHLQLCSMKDEKDINGYYFVCHSSSFVDGKEEADTSLCAEMPDSDMVSEQSDIVTTSTNPSKD